MVIADYCVVITERVFVLKRMLMLENKNILKCSIYATVHMFTELDNCETREFSEVLSQHSYLLLHGLS